MNKIVVAIKDIDFINNFDWLPKIFYSEKLDYVIYTHTSPESFSDSKGCVLYNFDIMVSMKFPGKTFNIDWEHILPKGSYFETKRLPKISQLVLLNNARTTYKTVNMKHIGIYLHEDEQNSIFKNPLGFANGKIVVKPTNGARGIGHYLVDTTKVSVQKIADIITKGELSDLDKFSEHVIRMGDVTKDGNEGFNMLRSGAFGQEYIPNIDNEYRIITGYDCSIAYAQKRVRSGTTIAQATGVTDTKDASNILTEEDIMNMLGADGKAFHEILKNVIGPLNSIDLFTTTDGEWGIFEFCNQFGTVGVPDEISKKLHEEFIEDLASKFLKSF